MPRKYTKVKESGEEEKFTTGAQRDIDDNKPRYDLIPSFALKRVADHYANGAKRYNEWNWARGMPFSRFLASAERHLQQFKQGDLTEDHLSAIVFNILAIIHFEELENYDLDDLPRFSKPRGQGFDYEGDRKIPWKVTRSQEAEAN